MMTSEPQLVFVCGVGRSGTSLLQLMLAGHPEILALPETTVLRRLVIPQRLERSKDIDELSRILDHDHRLAPLGLDWRDAFSSLDLHSATVGLDCYRLILRRKFPSGSIVLDKDPQFIEHIPYLIRHFPSCKIIQIVRDSRDVLSSKLKAEWSKDRHWLFHTVANIFQLSLGRAAKRRLPSSQYFAIKYEALLEHPERELSLLCNFLGLKFTVDLLDFQKKARELVRHDEESWKAKTFGPLLTQNVGKWKSNLSPLQACTTEYACSDTIVGGKGNWSFPVRVAALFLSIVAHIASKFLSMVR